jgi:hypothetical protein
MSVLNELQNHASAGGASTPRFNEGGEEQTGMMEMMEATSVPGQSLTQDPENKANYETPPQFTDIQDYVDEAFLDISDPETLPQLLDALRHEAPLEYLVEAYLQKDVQNGLITPDLMMLAIEPIIYILITMATYAGIDPNFAEDDDFDEDDEVNSETKELRMKANALLADSDENDDHKISASEMQAPSVAPKSLLARSKQAVAQVTEGEPNAEH